MHGRGHVSSGRSSLVCSPRQFLRALLYTQQSCHKDPSSATWECVGREGQDDGRGRMTGGVGGWEGQVDGRGRWMGGAGGWEGQVNGRGGAMGGAG